MFSLAPVAGFLVLLWLLTFPGKPRETAQAHAAGRSRRPDAATQQAAA